MDNNSMLRRLEMYAMVNSIENDLVENLSSLLELNDIPAETKNKCQNVSDMNSLVCVLRGLDLQGYIEILNKNVLKLHLTTDQKNFINTEFSKIIPIRNKVMHPRLFDFYDYPMLKACFENLPNQFQSFSWDNIKSAIRMINEEPSMLMQYEANLKKSTQVIENLPTVVDFEDTSFIGRAKEIGEIKAKLYRKNVHILTVIGDGGIGKTALTIKLLYDLLDDDRNPFELILWVSLKTKELNNYEFTEIQNSINDIGKMYQKLGSFVGVATGEKEIQKELVDLSKSFKTLLVLDNLETINTDDIRDFLDEFSEEGKVIITSRIGLGEMEHRYPLQGLSDTDLELYTDTLFQLYNIDNCFSNDEKIKYVKQDLHANPLAIKWFARGIVNGQTAQQLLQNKGDLIAFCMSNVYDKLSAKAKEILLVLKTAHAELSFAEMFFLIGKDTVDEPEIRSAVNELCKCNFIDSDIFKLNNMLSITEFAFEFIREHVQNDSSVEGRVKIGLKELHAFDQNMLGRQNNEPYALGTFHYGYGEKERLVAAYYLGKSVAAYNKGNETLAFLNIEIAKSLCPKYFECNRIAAYFWRNSDPQKALDEYDIAKKNALNQEELRLVYIAYKEFCVSNADYVGALTALDQAITIRDEILLQLEKVKILGCVAKYDDALDILDKIDDDCLKEPKYSNLYLTRRADIYRRQSELYRDYKERFEILKKAHNTLSKISPMDKNALNVLAVIVKELIYIGYDLEAVTYAYKILKTADKDIFKTPGIKELRPKMVSLSSYIPEFEGKSDLLTMLVDYDSVLDSLEENEGIVYYIKDSFGFAKNNEYPLGIFFLLRDAKYDVQIGDIVDVGTVFKTEKGNMTKCIKFKKHFAL